MSDFTNEILRDLDRKLDPSKRSRLSGKVLKFDGLTAHCDGFPARVGTWFQGNIRWDTIPTCRPMRSLLFAQGRAQPLRQHGQQRERLSLPAGVRGRADADARKRSGPPGL